MKYPASQEIAAEVLPAGPFAGEVPGSEIPPGTDIIGADVEPPDWTGTGDGDGAPNDSWIATVGGGITAGN